MADKPLRRAGAPEGGAGNFHEGSTTLSEISSLLFRGHLGPAPTAEATPNTGSPVDY